MTKGHDHHSHTQAHDTNNKTATDLPAKDAQQSHHSGHQHHSNHQEYFSSHNGHEEHLDSGHSNHGGHHEHMVDDFKKRFWVSLVVMIPITLLSHMLQELIGYTLHFPGSDLILFGLSSFIFFYGGWPFLKGAKSELLKEHAPGMMMLVSLAIIASYVYSTLTTFFIEGTDFYFDLATLIVVMLLGHWIEMRSQMGASKALEELIQLMPSEAHKLDENGDTTNVSVSELKPGDQIMVKSGEKVPLDGKISEGRSSIDESMLTGESVPVNKGPGEEVIGGSINGEGVLTITVSKVGKDTFLSQVVEMVRNAQGTKSKVQGFADVAAKWLFYIAVVAGLLTLIYWIAAADFEFALERMVTVFVIACPHALGLAMPLVSSVSTSIAAKNGLLIRNRTQFEDARKIDSIVFDKTGTLTEGNFGVEEIVPVKESSEDEVLQLAYSVESQSDHPIAKGIVREGEKRSVQRLAVSDYENLTGRGLKARVGSDYVSVLSPGGVRKETVDFDEKKYNELAEKGRTVVFVLENNQLKGMIALADIIRSSSYDVIQELTDENIESIMITGDNERVAKNVGKELGLSRVIAEVLPDEKSEQIRALKEKDGKKVAMVGDGINDAPALAQADIGIAIGAGTDVAIETADVVLVDSDPRDVLTVLKLSRATYRKNIQNLIWASGYNVIAIPLAAGMLINQGIVITPAIGAALMSLSTIIVAINARFLKID